jgi:hypothetical protein
MEAVLTTFLAPFLPYLVRKGEAVADKAIETLGGAAWERAQALWGKLRPRIEEKEAAREVADAVAANPDDEAARGALQFQLRTLLKDDPILMGELDRMLQEAQQAGVMADNGAVIIHGDVKADRGSVAAGRDVQGGVGGIRTGWREGDTK